MCENRWNCNELMDITFGCANVQKLVWSSYSHLRLYSQNFWTWISEMIIHFFYKMISMKYTYFLRLQPRKKRPLDGFKYYSILVIGSAEHLLKGMSISKSVIIPFLSIWKQGWLGRGRNAITARNSTKFVTTGGPTDRPTDTARCRVACLRHKSSKKPKKQKGDRPTNRPTDH